MKQSIAWVACGVIVSCAGTDGGGTETANPASLEHFASSECKSRAPEPGQQALALSSQLEGLQCIEWARGDAGVLNLRLSNFVEACGETYLGAAALAEEGVLELSVYKDTCEVLRCGSCLYDFDFRVSGLAFDAPLRIRTGASVCESQPVGWDDSLGLPVDEQPNGLICRYVRRNALEQYATTRATCGERNMPCGNCSSTGPETCGDGLTCAPVAEGDSRCLANCGSDSDCGPSMTCAGGLCQSKLDW